MAAAWRGVPVGSRARDVVVDVLKPPLGRGRHGHGSVELSLADVVGDQGQQGGVAVSLELALDQVRATAPVGGHIGHPEGRRPRAGRK